ncbi:MAG: phosphoribosylformylglycinamidine cyclo-ligase [Ilumatobacteraceae bacterium]|nr:phosphoribosylformylglycinamidine cyclo-ligase [Ilumatobacteraceae bacterium]
MKVLVIGNGGREAAITWACRHHGHHVDSAASLPTEFDEHTRPDLVIVGPEAALVAGVADRCAAMHIPCFGPTASLAKLESSKGFTRMLAGRLGLPSPAYHLSSDAEEAIAWWREFGKPVVVKLDGLAAGKGVIVPEGPDLHAATEAAIRELVAQGPIVLEERLSGPECSLMALCDGTVARPLPVAQDHKRIGEGDTGANTGGMGAYAPAPIPYDPDDLTAMFIQPVIDFLMDEGAPYIGVLYAGLMLTPDGPKLLEYNCRFGDPEAQAVLPLLTDDLAALALACCNGELGDRRINSQGAACTIVAAAAGYPAAVEAGAVIDFGDETTDALLFHAGTDGVEVTGGRVLAVTGLGANLAEARNHAYGRIATIQFDGMQVRRDIGWRAIGAGLSSYAAAGVDIDEGTRAVDQMKAAVERTHGAAVLKGVGSFGGVFSGAILKEMDEPLLVASTDGVGTKVELAARLGRYRGVGADIVNHCIDDVLVQGARPLFFLDYIASSKLDADQVAEVVTGMAEACEVAGCALLGGETAEMPGVYAPGAFDIAGTLVGAVDRAKLLPNAPLVAGDVLLGVASNGPHTNGYSLLRKLFEWLPMDAVPTGFDCTLGEALLKSHRNYVPVLGAAIDGGKVKALAHITGGGLPENLPRVLPDGINARIHLGSWPVPPLFQLVREVAVGMATHELYRTLNMGVGMVVVCAASDLSEVQASITEQTWVIGELITAAHAGRTVVLL